MKSFLKEYDYFHGPMHFSIDTSGQLMIHLWLLTMAINNPHLIDRKDEVDGYRGAIQME